MDIIQVTYKITENVYLLKVKENSKGLLNVDKTVYLNKKSNL